MLRLNVTFQRQAVRGDLRREGQRGGGLRGAVRGPLQAGVQDLAAAVVLDAQDAARPDDPAPGVVHRREEEDGVVLRPVCAKMQWRGPAFRQSRGGAACCTGIRLIFWP